MAGFLIQMTWPCFWPLLQEMALQHGSPFLWLPFGLLPLKLISEDADFSWLFLNPLFSPGNSQNNFIWVCVFSHSQMRVSPTSLPLGIWIYSSLLTWGLTFQHNPLFDIHHSFIYLYIYVCVCAYVFKCVGTHTAQHVRDGQRTAGRSQVSPSAMWVQRATSFRSSDLAVAVSMNYIISPAPEGSP